MVTFAIPVTVARAVQRAVEQPASKPALAAPATPARPDQYSAGGRDPRALIGGDARALPAQVSTAARRRKVDTTELAGNPGDAHQAWRSLNKGQRAEVLDKMGKRYGTKFAEKFAEATKNKSLRSDLTRTYGPGVGPSEEKLVAQGYKPLARAYYNEIWVHPSGEMVMKVLDRGSTKSADKTKTAPLDPRVEDAKDVVDGMQSWFDTLSKMDPSDPDYGDVHTDFWSHLTQERDALKESLAHDPDLDAPTRAALEKQLEKIEELNDRRAALPEQLIAAPEGSYMVVVDKWLYVQPND